MNPMDFIDECANEGFEAVDKLRDGVLDGLKYVFIALVYLAISPMILAGAIIKLCRGKPK